MVAEGRKVLRNLQRVAKLFVAKSSFAAFLILSIGLTATAYPLLPRHLTLAATLTIGIPAFFLALAPSSGAVRDRRVPARGLALRRARRARPPGSASSPRTCSRSTSSQLPLIEARTIATTVLVAVGLYLVLALEARGAPRRGSARRRCSAARCSSLYFVVLALPGDALVLRARRRRPAACS